METHPIYTLRPAEVFAALDTSPQGLPSSEVSARQELYGRNILSEELHPSLGRKLLGFFTHPFALLLLAAGLSAVVVGEILLGLVIWLLVLVNTGFSFWREHRAEQAMQALKQLLPVYARVIRAGVETQILAIDLVPGDILVLAEGDNIPADGRVVEEYGLRTNEATLTGDAMPARKTADASLREGISELERPNLIFAGTSVVSGTGRAVISSSGMLTQFGRIAHLTQAVKDVPTPLQVELARLTRSISLVSIAIGAIVFLVGVFDVGLPWLEAFLLGVGIIVAAIPEGLPATITLSLAMAGQRLAQRGVLVKKLSVIETLGTVSTICTDKSGTLTQNQMTVREMWVSGQRLSVSGVGYEPHGEFTPDPASQPHQVDLNCLLAAAALCNNSRLSPPTPDRPQWTSLGDQTEAAMRVAALKGAVNEADLAKIYPRVHELPFDARRKRMSTIHQLQHKGPSRSNDVSHPPILVSFPVSRSAPAPVELAFVKGAPREVLQLCKYILTTGEVQALEEGARSEILKELDDYAGRTLRVLALAYRQLPPRAGSYTVEKVEQELTFIGLMAMHDPPRPEVAEAVQTCLQAGIRMVMVTGDYGLTAQSLARRVGMLTRPDSLIVTGAELDSMDETELNALLEKEALYSRMAPEHKLRLVAALQARGEVVAVTGDGVNDAPALRKADVGISMGITGTDVSKEAADLVLTNDNFASIVSAIQEGRAVYDNVRKFITYIFSSNVPEILPFIMTAMFRFPLALTVRQILLIDLGTDMFPALGLGMEQPEPDVMRRPPRRRNQPVVDRSLLLRAFAWLGLIEVILCYGGFFFVFAISGRVPFLPLPGMIKGALELPPDQVLRLASTVFLAGVVMAQVGNAFACRTEYNRGRALGWLRNRFLWFGVAVELVLILLVIYFPPLARAFDHLPLPPWYWLWLSLFGPVVYSLDWIRKRLLRWWKQVRSG